MTVVKSGERHPGGVSFFAEKNDRLRLNAEWIEALRDEMLAKYELRGALHNTNGIYTDKVLELHSSLDIIGKKATTRELRREYLKAYKSYEQHVRSERNYSWLLEHFSAPLPIDDTEMISNHVSSTDYEEQRKSLAIQRIYIYCMETKNNNPNEKLDPAIETVVENVRAIPKSARFSNVPGELLSTLTWERLGIMPDLAELHKEKLDQRKKRFKKIGSYITTLRGCLIRF